MKYLLVIIFAVNPFISLSQSVEKYFESIRNNTAELNAFFSQMPKGGDLHNHYSGSVYAETYLQYVVERNYFVNLKTFEVDSLDHSQDNSTTNNWSRFGDLDSKKLGTIKQNLMQKWSTKDYNGVSYPCDKQFFEAFAAFGIANNNDSRLEVGLLELKNRAKKENVSYIELMFTNVPGGSIKISDTSLGKQLAMAQTNHDENATTALLDKMYLMLKEKNVDGAATDYVENFLKPIHTKLGIDDSTFTMRYQTYVSRSADPVTLFKNVVLSFESANRSPLIVGVNIVAPEDGEVSMRDYWLHMQMFKYCHKKYPQVKYAMHAGELTLGLVKPEELTWHINEAVRVAGANRIGHGVDMAWEHNPYDLLKYMAKNKVAIEINLYSNEFILKVKNDVHPLKLYHDFKVPMVICTDDAGILRSNLIHQYELLASRYKYISYGEIKSYVYNSIDYSFIKDEETRKKIKNQLDKKFKAFETEIISLHQ